MAVGEVVASSGNVGSDVDDVIVVLSCTPDAGWPVGPLSPPPPPVPPLLPPLAAISIPYSDGKGEH